MCVPVCSTRCHLLTLKPSFSKPNIFSISSCFEPKNVGKSSTSGWVRSTTFEKLTGAARAGLGGAKA